MNLKVILGASLIAIAANGSAFAADAIMSQEPVPFAAPMFSWGGAYIGGEIGWGWGRDKLDGDGVAMRSSSRTASSAVSMPATTSTWAIVSFSVSTPISTIMT